MDAHSVFVRKGDEYPDRVAFRFPAVYPRDIFGAGVDIAFVHTVAVRADLQEYRVEAVAGKIIKHGAYHGADILLAAHTPAGTVYRVLVELRYPHRTHFTGVGVYGGLFAPCGGHPRNRDYLCRGGDAFPARAGLYREKAHQHGEDYTGGGSFHFHHRYKSIIPRGGI